LRAGGAGAWRTFVARIGALSLPGRGFGFAEPVDANGRVFCAAAKQAATLAFVQDGEFDFIPARAELCECPVKGVFDGFAACFC
jgi:hypothetical protein